MILTALAQMAAPSAPILVGLALVVGLLRPAASTAEIAPEDKRSDIVLLSEAVRAMQADDTANPGMLSVLDGEALWTAKPPSDAPACAGCHGEAAASMRGAAARHPAWNAARAAPVDLAGQINNCRETRQSLPPLPAESPGLLALTAFVAHQSRGMSITPASGPGMAAARGRGEQLFTARLGQLNLSCAQCHDERWGQSLAGAPIPQAHPVGYPIYRLEWQAVGSLQRRFRNCLTGIRAEPFPFGAPEFVDLETYLMDRAAGLRIESPAVRP